MGMTNSTLANRPLGYWCSFEYYPKWKGNKFYVFEGFAYRGRDYQTKKKVAIKTFCHLDANTSDWKLYTHACAMGRKYAEEFNRYLSALGVAYRVSFVTPADVVMDDISDVMKLTRIVKRFKKSFSENEIVVFEEFLKGDFKTFITSNGRLCEIGSDILGSFCHFVYHQSGGELILSNLKGVFEDNQGNHFRLTCPTLHSMSKSYGREDGGESGINQFFGGHVCTRVCNGLLDVIPKEPSAPSTSDGWDKPIPKEPYAPTTTHTMPQPPEYTTIDPNQLPSYKNNQCAGIAYSKTAKTYIQYSTGTDTCRAELDSVSN